MTAENHRSSCGTSVASPVQTVQLNDKFLRSLWANRLPPYIQAIIATQNKLALDEVAQLADKVSEVMPPHIQNHVAATTSTPSATSSTTNLSDLAQQVDVLRKQVAALQTSQGRSRSRSRGRSGGNSYREWERSRSTDRYCWYHSIFKQQAHKCRSPCKFPRSTGNEKSSH